MFMHNKRLMRTEIDRVGGACRGRRRQYQTCRHRPLIATRRATLA